MFRQINKINCLIDGSSYDRQVLRQLYDTHRFKSTLSMR